MAENESTEEVVEETVDESTTDAETVEDDKPLGPSGEKALAAMKARVKAAEAEARAAKRRADDAERQSMSAQEKAVADAKSEAASEVGSRYKQRIIASEIKAAAGGRLADPADAVRLLDLTQFELDDNDDLDAAAVKTALDGLLKAKPYLAAARAKSDADQGFRGDAKKTLAEQIAEAEKAGDFATAGLLKAQQLTQSKQ